MRDEGRERGWKKNGAEEGKSRRWRIKNGEGEEVEGGGGRRRKGMK